MSLVFREADHTYWLDGQWVPNVTSIIKPLTDLLYGGVTQDVLDAAAERGRAVHLACQFDDEGDLDDATLDPLLLPYVQAWRKFKRDTGAAVLESEQPNYHKVLRYAGTPDCRVLIRNRHWLIDRKATSSILSSVHVQLQGYEEMLRSHGLPVDERAAVHLRDDGDYRLHLTAVKDMALHRATFHSLLTFHNWKARYVPA